VLIPESKGAFPHIAGMTFSIDVNKSAGERVHSMKLNGKAMDMKAEYLVATNDFMAAGGDEYVSFKDSAIVNEFPALDEALIVYIQKLGKVNVSVDKRITVEEAPTAEEPESPVVTKPTPVVYWDGDILKKGQIGRVTVNKAINLWKRTATNKLEFVRILKSGETYRVYNFDSKYGGQYGVGGGYFITNMKSHIKYETPSKVKLQQLQGK